MAVFKPELHRLEDVIQYYEQSNAIEYKIYAGTSPKFEFCRYNFDNDEKEIGLQKLYEALKAIEQNIENTNPYILQLIEKKKGLKNKIEDQYTQIVFQLNKADRYLPMMSGMGIQPPANNDLNRLMEKMIETQNLIVSKMSIDENDFEIEAEEKPKGFGAILENEQFQNLAIGALGAIISKFLGTADNTNVMSLAGLPSEQKEMALQAVEILEGKDPNFGKHLLYLANLDQSNYNMLLSFIK
jgi:hypothetical protein